MRNEKMGKMLRRKPKLNQSGNAGLILLSSMVMMGVSYIAGNLTRFEGAHDYLRNARLISARDAIAEQIRQVGELPAAFRSSISPDLGSLNEELRACLINAAGCSLDTTQEYPIAMYLPRGNQLQQVTGGVGAPVRYDADGRYCQNQATASLTCPFEVRTTFRVACAAAPCTEPQVNISYEISFAQSLTNGNYRLPPIISVSGSTNPLSKQTIYPPTHDYEAVMIRSEMIVVNVEETESTPPPAVNPVVEFLRNNWVTNEAYLEAVVRAGLTDGQQALDMWTNRRGTGRRGATADQLMAYIETYREYGPELSRVAFMNRDLNTAEQMDAYIQPVREVESRTLAAALLQYGRAEPESISRFVDGTRGMDEPQAIRVAVRANVSDRDRLRAFDSLVDELDWASDDVAYAILMANVTNEETALLLRDVWNLNVETAVVIREANIRDYSVASAIVWSMPDPTTSKATSFNNLISSSGVRDHDVVHEAAWRQVTTVAEVLEIQAAHEAAEAEAARIAAEQEAAYQQELANMTSTSESSSNNLAVVAPETTTSTTSSTSTSSSSSTQTTTTVRSTSGTDSGTSVSISAQLLSTCTNSTCPIISF